MNTLSGYSKLTLSDNYVLTAAGGHLAVGNADKNVPINNGVTCTNLKAQYSVSAENLNYTYSNQSINFSCNENKLRLIRDVSSNATTNGYPNRYCSGLSVLTDYTGWQMVTYGNIGTPNPYFRMFGDDGKRSDWKQLAFIDNIPTKVSQLTNDSGYVTGGPYLPSANYTAADILNKLKTVDGTGSGLDADTLDGLNSSSFLLKSQYGFNVDTYTFNVGSTATGWIYLGYFYGNNGGIKIECDYASHCGNDYGICSSHLTVGVRPYTLQGFISKVKGNSGGLYITESSDSGYKYYHVYIYLGAWWQGQIRIQALGSDSFFTWTKTAASPNSSYSVVLDTRNLDGYYVCHKGVLTNVYSYNPTNYYWANVGVSTTSSTTTSPTFSTLTTNYYRYAHWGGTLPHSSGNAWYNVYSSTINTAGETVILKLSHSYYYTYTDAVVFAITIGYGTATITQLSSSSHSTNGQIFKKVRVRFVNNATVYIDVEIYSHTARTDSIYVTGTGTGTFCAPTATSDTTGKVAEISVFYSGFYSPTAKIDTLNGGTPITSANIGSQSVNYATSSGNADTVDNYHASSLVKFYLSPLESNAPAASAKSWFTGTMPSSSGAIVYNVPGSEKTIIAGKSSGSYGHMLQLNYDDTYLRILRYAGGSWKSTDWEKISAGYADSANSATTAGTCTGNAATATYATSAGSATSATSATTATTASRLSLTPTQSAQNNCVPAANYMQCYRTSASDTGGGDGWIQAYAWDGNYVTQLYFDVDPTYNLSVRHRNNEGSWTTWKKIAYTTDIPTTMAWGSITGKPSMFTPSSHTHSYITPYGEGSVANTRTANSDVAVCSGGWASTSAGYGSQYGTTLDVSGYSTWYHRLAFRTDGTIEYWQGINTKTMTKVGNISFSNTWRPITDSYSGTDSSTSLSQKGGKALYDALVNGYASSAGTANGCYYVYDYNATTTPIYIGYAGAGLSTCSHFAAYGTTSSGARCIKDLSVANAKTVLGIPTVYARDIGVNGTNWTFYSSTNAATTSIYAPTSVGTSGYILQSNGSGAPSWTSRLSYSYPGVIWVGYIYRSARSYTTWYTYPMGGSATVSMYISSPTSTNNYQVAMQSSTHTIVGGMCSIRAQFNAGKDGGATNEGPLYAYSTINVSKIEEAGPDVLVSTVHNGYFYIKAMRASDDNNSSYYFDGLAYTGAGKDTNALPIAQINVILFGY